MSLSSSTPVAGSFRDREGRVYQVDGRIIRGLSQAALASHRQLVEQPFYQQALKDGRLVGTREIPADQASLPAQELSQWAGFLEHDVIPVISYPYEWTFSMLKAAALLQLQLTEAAVQAGFTLKDASPYNFQFVGRRPVMIDIASFTPLPDGMPWAGYRQFCEMFLFPLLLQAYKHCHFQPFLRASMNGVDVHTAAALFSWRDRLRRGVFSHVWLQARLDSSYGGSGENVRASLKSAGFNRELILVNLRKLQKLVSALQWQPRGSQWGDYDQCHNYSDADHQAKETFVAEAVRHAGPDTLWDIGCNTGQFSRVAAPLCRQVVAMDIDHLAVERQFLDPTLPGNILPLLQNVADPSPNWGWRLAERSELAARSTPDLVLCLALIHHVVISANIPLAEFVAWLGGLGEALVMEYVSRKDDKVRALLQNKEDIYQDYSRANLETCLQRNFTIEKRLEISAGNRYLYYCRRRMAGQEIS